MACHCRPLLYSRRCPISAPSVDRVANFQDVPGRVATVRSKESRAAGGFYGQYFGNGPFFPFRALGGFTAAEQDLALRGRLSSLDVKRLACHRCQFRHRRTPLGRHRGQLRPHHADRRRQLALPDRRGGTKVHLCWFPARQSHRRTTSAAPVRSGWRSQWRLGRFRHRRIRGRKRLQRTRRRRIIGGRLRLDQRRAHRALRRPLTPTGGRETGARAIRRAGAHSRFQHRMALRKMAAGGE